MALLSIQLTTDTLPFFRTERTTELMVNLLKRIATTDQLFEHGDLLLHQVFA